MDIVRIGLIGTGGICNAVHIPGYLSYDKCRITAICDNNPAHLKKTGDRLGLPEECRFADYHDLLASGLVDAVDVTTSNDMHVPIALDALDAGLPVSVEKPIGINFAQSLALEKKSRETGLPVFVCFSWRYRNDMRYMRDVITSGQIGEVYHMYIHSIKDSGLWEGRRLEWRFEEERAGSGVLCDLGSHMFDMVRFFGEEFESVSCDRGIVVHERQREDSDEWATVTTDDWANVICTLKNGCSATVDVSRAVSSEAAETAFYVSGSKGAVHFADRGGFGITMEVCLGEDVKTHTFRPVPVPETVPGLQSRSYVDLLLGKPDKYAATISEGVYSQVAVDAAKISSDIGRRVHTSEVLEGKLV